MEETFACSVREKEPAGTPAVQNLLYKICAPRLSAFKYVARAATPFRRNLSTSASPISAAFVVATAITDDPAPLINTPASPSWRNSRQSEIPGINTLR